ncbi:MAG: RNA-binding transcriptional accessory protein [Clostridiales bacterium GWE2_32_10]|nr:MAG: RNA-binding transcriptional accessory protein [Clostridiales bacterium GWE2_32_10]HBY21508.1 RNA-binding transcriptional accessory protein [Clostridiales bacterium]
MDIILKLERELGISKWQVENVIGLIDEGNTIPFISRYRKEMTGSLDDEVLRKFDERLKYLRNLEDRKTQVIKIIEEQGKLTDELKASIQKAETLVEVEDLYRPYKQKRQTRATKAIERGLAPLAELIWLQQVDKPVEEYAKEYINEEKGVNTVEEAISGAKDILAERVSDEPVYRKWIRNHIFRNGILVSKATGGESEKVYEMYFEYNEAVLKIPGHRVLAINRGENEKQLSVKIDVDVDRIYEMLIRNIIKRNNIFTTDILKAVIEDSYKRLIFPSVEREIRSELTEKAEDGAIVVFAKNLKQILMQPPIVGKTVLGLDPAYRTGCKIAVVDATGKALDTVVIYPTPPQSKTEEAKEVLKKLINKHDVEVIAIGNGTASRESEQFVVDLLKEVDKQVFYVIVNEAGASVYSASELATKEFPDFDVAQRSAISIARRLQDPLSELVKIDPKSIGVGQYQHDMNQKKLKENLSAVVEDTVNTVGVDLNTASASLLKYVSGISEQIANNIVDYRETNSRFNSRAELLKVKKLGGKTYEQCAGFLRILDGKNPFDNTGIHPESYKHAQLLIKKLEYTENDLRNKRINIDLTEEEKESLAQEINIGLPTLTDIINDLKKPGRDPREDMPKPILRSDVLEMKDLKEGMILNGTVRNLVDFGVFVDIGVHQDGLVHLSEIIDRYIKHPMEVLSVGDIVKVMVTGVDEKRNRISLSIKKCGK